MTNAPASGWARWRKPAGFVVGILLIAAAIVVLAQSRDALREATDAAVHAPVWIIGVMLLLPVGNAAVVAWSFQVLMSRFGRVP
ncbi:MAG: hypothetical protein AAGF47_01395 [Planctomycetota bacterium]